MKGIFNYINPFKFIDFGKSIYIRLYSIFDALIIILSFLIFYYSLKIDFDSEISKSISYEFIENFQTGYYLDFKICTPNENRIKLDTWKGTLKGCGKIKDNKSSVRILSDNDNCYKDEIVLEKIPPQNIYSFKGLTLCGKTKGNYYDLLFSNSVVGEKEDCPKGKKNCGYIDTVKNKLCLDKESQCPVSFIQIKDIESNPPENITNLKVIKTEKIAFFYSNEPYANSSEIPYIQNAFKIADSEICTLPNLYHSNVDLYRLDANSNKFSSNCNFKSYPQQVPVDHIRYHEINTINQYELYSENKILDKIIANHLNLYGYNIEKYKENALHLYIGTHFGFNKACLKKRNPKKEISDIFSVSENMNIWSKKIRYNCFFLFLFSLKGFINTNYNKINMVLSPVFIISSFFLSFHMLIDTFFYGASYGQPYKQNMECSDFVSNSNYNIMIKKLQSNGNSISSCLLFIFLIFVLNILYIFILFAEKSWNDWFIQNFKRIFPNISINSENDKEEEKKL
jgi:hypothetical protein